MKIERSDADHTVDRTVDDTADHTVDRTFDDTANHIADRTVDHTADHIADHTVDPAADTMMAIRYHERGGPVVLRCERIPRPSPAAGELLVRVRASSVNPGDW